MGTNTHKDHKRVSPRNTSPIIGYNERHAKHSLAYIYHKSAH